LELWRIVSGDEKADLIFDFIFRPEVLKTRYHNEKKIRGKLKGCWKYKKT